MSQFLSGSLQASVNTLNRKSDHLADLVIRESTEVMKNDNFSRRLFERLDCFIDLSLGLITFCGLWIGQKGFVFRLGHRDLSGSPTTNRPQPFRKPVWVPQAGQGSASDQECFLRGVFRQMAVRQPGTGNSYSQPIVSLVQQSKTCQVTLTSGCDEILVRTVQDPRFWLEFEEITETARLVQISMHNERGIPGFSRETTSLTKGFSSGHCPPHPSGDSDDHYGSGSDVCDRSQADAASSHEDRGQ